MPERRSQLDRETLYQRVWSAPLSKLAGEFGVSDVALGKLCRRHQIPLPGRGYWVRLRHGAAPEPPPIPAARRGASEQITFSRRRRVRMGHPSIPDVTVHPDRDQPGEQHPLVVRTERALRATRPDHYGLCTPLGRDVLSIKVSSAAACRALSLFDGLIRVLEQRGHTVRVVQDPKPRTLIVIGGEDLSISLTERIFRTSRSETALSTGRSATWSPFEQKYDYRPSGRLRVRARELEFSGLQYSWSDGRGRLERKVGEVVGGLEQGAAHLAQETARRRERWRQEEEARAESEAEASRREADLKREKLLREQAADWAAAKAIRSYLDVLERATQEEPSAEDARAVIRWANELANRIDPIRSGRWTLLR